LAFLAQEVPAFGIARFRLSPGKPHTPQRSVPVKDGVLENGSVRARINATSGSIVELALHGSHDNLVDSSRGEAVNEYRFPKEKTSPRYREPAQ
jgi:hypothetical protein